MVSVIDTQFFLYEMINDLTLRDSHLEEFRSVCLGSNDNSLSASHKEPPPLPRCVVLLCLRVSYYLTSVIQRSSSFLIRVRINHLTPNGHYMGRTAQLTSRCCILYIYSTNIRTEYFKHVA